MNRSEVESVLLGREGSRALLAHKNDDHVKFGAYIGPLQDKFVFVSRDVYNPEEHEVLRLIPGNNLSIDVHGSHLSVEFVECFVGHNVPPKENSEEGSALEQELGKLYHSHESVLQLAESKARLIGGTNKLRPLHGGRTGDYVMADYDAEGYFVFLRRAGNNIECVSINNRGVGETHGEYRYTGKPERFKVDGSEIVSIVPGRPDPGYGSDLVKQPRAEQIKTFSRYQSILENAER